MKNEVSEGSERKVINAVGIFQNAEKGDAERIAIAPSLTRTLPGKPVDYVVYGLDEYENRIEIPAAEVTMQAAGVEGAWSGYTFTPAASGTYEVTAEYNGMTASLPGMACGRTARLKPSNADIKLDGVGATAKIAMTALDDDGFSYWVSTSTNYTVADESIGTMNSNVFTAKNNGSTYIKCEKDGAEAYISVTVGDGEKAQKPADTVPGDPLNKAFERTADGAYYLNIAGKVAYTGSEKIEESVYNNARSKAKGVIDANAEVAIYGGKNDIQSATALDSMSWTGEYRFLNRGGVSLAMVSAAKGGITATEPSQWMKLTQDIEAAGNDVIILVTDKTPSEYVSAAETNYLRAILGKYTAQGKKVFVVSCYGQSYWSSVKDGVRYLNLPNLWKADGSANGDFRMLRFRVDGGDVAYDVVNIK